MPDAAAHKLQQTVDEITGYTKRTRKLVFGLVAVSVVSLALAIVVALVLIGTRSQTSRLNSQTAALHSTQVAGCQGANDIRAKERQFWATFLSIAEGPHPDAKVKAVVATLLQDVDKTFVSRDCSMGGGGR